MHTVLPFSQQELLQHLTQKHTSNSYVVDYPSCKITGKGFLSYIINGDINAMVLNFDQQLFTDYLTLNNIPNYNNMTYVHANMLIYHVSNKQTIFDERVKSHYVFNFDECYETNKHIIENHVKCLKFLPCFILSKKFPNEDQYVDPLDFSIFGKSFISCLTIPYFFDIFMSEICKNNDMPSVFPSNFNDYIFKGNNLFYYVPQESIATLSMLAT